MRDALAQRGLPPDNLHVINNFCVPIATDAAIRPIRAFAVAGLRTICTCCLPGTWAPFRVWNGVLEAARRLRR